MDLVLPLEICVYFPGRNALQLYCQFRFHENRRIKYRKITSNTFATKYSSKLIVSRFTCVLSSSSIRFLNAIVLQEKPLTWTEDYQIIDNFSRSLLQQHLLRTNRIRAKSEYACRSQVFPTATNVFKAI